jgi:hypothetical protein
MTVVIALLQPTPEVWALFDEVVLLREGQVVYHGPRESVGTYFRDLGFQPPEPAEHASAIASAASGRGGFVPAEPRTHRASSAAEGGPDDAVAALAAATPLNFTLAAAPLNTTLAAAGELVDAVGHAIRRASSAGAQAVASVQASDPVVDPAAATTIVAVAPTPAAGTPAPSAVVPIMRTVSDGTRNRTADLADWLVEMLTSPARVYAQGQRDARSDDLSAAAKAAAGTGTAGAPDAVPFTPTASAGNASQPKPGAHDPSAPTNTTRLAAAWRASDLHTAQMKAPPAAPPLALTNDWARAQFGHAYSHPWLLHLGLLVKRQFTLMRRNPLYMRARLMGAIIMSVVLGGLYWQRSLTEGLTFFGVSQPPHSCCHVCCSPAAARARPLSYVNPMLRPPPRNQAHPRLTLSRLSHARSIPHWHADLPQHEHEPRFRQLPGDGLRRRAQVHRL